MGEESHQGSRSGSRRIAGLTGFNRPNLLFPPRSGVSGIIGQSEDHFDTHHILTSIRRSNLSFLSFTSRVSSRRLQAGVGNRIMCASISFFLCHLVQDELVTIHKHVLYSLRFADHRMYGATSGVWSWRLGFGCRTRQVTVAVRAIEVGRLNTIIPSHGHGC